MKDGLGVVTAVSALLVQHCRALSGDSHQECPLTADSTLA
jgi:hypothetical protein